MKRWLKNERGFTLLEVIVALGIFGVVGVAFIAALSSSFQTQDITKEQVQGENLVRSALEEIRFLPYQATYTPSVPVPTQYALTVTTTQYVDALGTPYPLTEIQKNTATASRDGRALVTVEDLKTLR